MNKKLKLKLLESYIKQVAETQAPVVKEVMIQSEDTGKLTPEQEQIKTAALDTAKEFSDLNKKLLSIKTTYDQNAKTDLKRFVREIFGDPFSNLTKMAEIAYEIAENIILKLKISGQKEVLTYKKLIEELTNLIPEATKIVNELVNKYTEIKQVDDNLESQVMGENFAQEFKNLLSGTKNWAVKFNYKTEYLKNKVEQLYYKFKNPKLFYKE
jgi:hypothetical protein